MKPINIASEIMRDLESNFFWCKENEEFGNDLIISFLRDVEKTMGIRYMAKCIKPYPNKGYMVRYLDNKVAGMIDEKYQKDLDETETMIKEMLK